MIGDYFHNRKHTLNGQILFIFKSTFAMRKEEYVVRIIAICCNIFNNPS